MGADLDAVGASNYTSFQIVYAACALLVLVLSLNRCLVYARVRGADCDSFQRTCLLSVAAISVLLAITSIDPLGYRGLISYSVTNVLLCVGYALGFALAILFVAQLLFMLSEFTSALILAMLCATQAAAVYIARRRIASARGRHVNRLLCYCYSSGAVALLIAAVQTRQAVHHMRDDEMGLFLPAEKAHSAAAAAWYLFHRSWGAFFLFLFSLIVLRLLWSVRGASFGLSALRPYEESDGEESGTDRLMSKESPRLRHQLETHGPAHYREYSRGRNSLEPAATCATRGAANGRSLAPGRAAAANVPPPLRSLGLDDSFSIGAHPLFVAGSASSVRSGGGSVPLGLGLGGPLLLDQFVQDVGGVTVAVRSERREIGPSSSRDGSTEEEVIFGHATD
eukprot:g7672.t1